MKRVIIKTVSPFAVLAFLPAFGSGERLFAPSLDPWPKWEAHDASSTAVIDHGVWNGHYILGNFMENHFCLKEKESD